MHRSIASVCFMLVALVFAAPALRAGAQEAPAAEASAEPVNCALPNAPARTLKAVMPIAPSAAKNVSGDVAVIVTLDEHSKVVGAAISRTPSALLNDAALTATRASTFETRIESCRPVAGKYIFVVSFVGATAFVAPPDMTNYFLGKWDCESEDHPRIVEDFHTGSEGATLVDVSSTFDRGKPATSRAQSYGLRAGKIGVTEQTGAQIFRAVSKGWNGTDLIFTGKTWNEDTGVELMQRMTYARTGNANFVRTLETAPSAAGPWTQTARERCARA